MKKILYSMLMLAMAAFTFTSCEDVPAPYDDPNKDETGGVKSRCIPFGEHEKPSDVCACCGKPAKHLVVWGRQY